MSILPDRRLPVWLVVLLWALFLRAVFAVLTAGTFDQDEFVVLAFSRAIAHGAVPYHSFTFFHPPGMLLLFAWLQPLVGLWWPFARIVTLAVDSLTAVLVWRVGKEIFDDRRALVAGLLYGASPIALVSAVRVGPDPFITALGVAGLALLLTTPSRRGALAAGVCLALAVWIKYPALLFLPIYVVAAPRRLTSVLPALVVAIACLFAPFVGELHALFNQTVLWQAGGRQRADLVHRLAGVGGYWLLANPLAVLAMWRVRRPIWLPMGFCLGALFLFTPEAYYHYFVICVPFGALLAAPILEPLVRRSPRLVALAATALCGVWAVDVGYGSPPARLFVAATSLAAVEQTARIIDRSTNAEGVILTDHFEYALFAHRQPVLNYFWNMQGVVSARTLERDLPHVTAIVETKEPNTYPHGFGEYLQDRGFRRIQTTKVAVWLMQSTSPRQQSAVRADRRFSLRGTT